jgi:hypothetical protein
LGSGPPDEVRQGRRAARTGERLGRLWGRSCTLAQGTFFSSTDCFIPSRRLLPVRRRRSLSVRRRRSLSSSRARAGHTDLTTRSAEAVRAMSCSERPERAALLGASGSAPSWRRRGGFGRARRTMRRWRTGPGVTGFKQEVLARGSPVASLGGPLRRPGAPRPRGPRAECPRRTRPSRCSCVPLRRAPVVPCALGGDASTARRSAHRCGSDSQPRPRDESSTTRANGQ